MKRTSLFFLGAAIVLVIILAVIVINHKGPKSCAIKELPAVGTSNKPVLSMTGKKVFYINSYHAGYEWSDKIESSIAKSLEEARVTLKIFRMDSKRNTGDEFMKEKAQQAKAEIEEFRPDVIITSDDNAFKHIIMPFYKDDPKMPVVFCGLNWDASLYDAPYKNTTGMVEVALIPALINHLSQYAKGQRIGYLAADVLTAKKEGHYYKKYFDIVLVESYVKSFEEWKTAFINIQKKVDILIVGNNAGINDWDEKQAENFVQENTRIPTGTIYSFLMKYSVLGLTKVEEEQGLWAAQTALKILQGTQPGEIPLVKNVKGTLAINLTLADNLNIAFTPSMLKNAVIIENQ